MENAVRKENMKTMNAVYSCRQGPSCISNGRGVGPESSYRSRKYNPDPRYHQSQADPLYISSEEAYRQLKYKPKNQFIYNMPKKSEINGPSENVQGEQDSSDSYPHRDINNAYTNLQNPNARPCLREARTFYVCSECGCSFPKDSEDRERNSKNECRPSQDANSGRRYSNTNEAEVSVECKPEMISENGSQIIYFTFNINENPEDQYESSCPSPQIANPNENPHNCIDFDASDDEWDDGIPIKIGSRKSPLLWWNCDQPGCLCQAIQKGNGSSSAANYNYSTTQAQSTGSHSKTNCPVPNHTKNNDQELCTEICTIRGENGEIIKIPCHHCFNVEETRQFAKNDMPRNGRNSNRNSKNHRQQGTNQNGQCSERNSGPYLCRDIDRRQTNHNSNRDNDQGIQCVTNCSSCRCQPNTGNGFDKRKSSETRGQLGMNSTNRSGPSKKSLSHDRTSSKLNKNRESDKQLENSSCGCGCLCHNFPEELWQNENDKPTSYEGQPHSNSFKNKSSTSKRIVVRDRRFSSHGHGRVLPSNGGNAL